MAYSRDGRRLATVERERGVTLWDVASQKAARDSRFVPAGYWRADRASLNPAGTLLAAGSAEGPVRLWDVATGQEVARLEGHDKDSLDVAFHPDGSLLATTGVDGTVRLWDVATHAPVAVLRGHTDNVWRVAFSADGKLLASGSNDKTIRLWDAQTHEQLAVIPAGEYCLRRGVQPRRHAAGRRLPRQHRPPVRRRQPPASRRAARPHRLRPRRRLEPRRHPARLRLRRLHGSHLGFAVAGRPGPAARRLAPAPLDQRILGHHLPQRCHIARRRWHGHRFLERHLREGGIGEGHAAEPVDLAAVDVQVIGLGPARQEPVPRLDAERCPEEHHEERMAFGVEFFGCEGLECRDGRKLRGAPQERGDLITQGLLEMVLDPGLQNDRILAGGVEDDIPAGDEGRDVR